MKLRVSVDGQLYEVEIGDLNTRPVVALVDGERFEVWPESQQSNPVTSSNDTPAPIAVERQQITTTQASSNTVYAPIPGMIETIVVKVGDTVTVGQELIILEAMKMKNVIRATQEGQIAAIHVTVGKQVKHHDPLLDYA